MIRRMIVPPEPVVLARDASYQGQIYGFPPQWGDGDAASYAEIWVRYGTAATLQRQAADTFIPAQPEVRPSDRARVGVWWDGHVDGDSPGLTTYISETRGTNRRLVPDSSAPVHPDGPLTAPAPWKVVELFPSTGFTMAEVLTRWRSQGLWLRFLPLFPDPRPAGVTIKKHLVWEARVVVYFPGVVLPPLRQFPRSDGLGTSPPRKWPPAPSRQASLRRHGGYR